MTTGWKSCRGNVKNIPSLFFPSLKRGTVLVSTEVLAVADRGFYFSHLQLPLFARLTLILHIVLYFFSQD